mmetsp:Transcript_129388/g.374708  ORF Transcript_129388/g.374708 Transcript_129388/m.374708 type:complete len:211 (-) Transcript_129388:388-1020(-)
MEVRLPEDLLGALVPGEDDGHALEVHVPAARALRVPAPPAPAAWRRRVGCLGLLLPRLSQAVGRDLSEVVADLGGPDGIHRGLGGGEALRAALLLLALPLLGPTFGGGLLNLLAAFLGVVLLNAHRGLVGWPRDPSPIGDLAKEVALRGPERAQRPRRAVAGDAFGLGLGARGANAAAPAASADVGQRQSRRLCRLRGLGRSSGGGELLR